MRPAGDVRLALLGAARELATPDRAPTLQELARKAGVAERAALDTVKNLKRCGALKIERLRKVAYRNRPVAEYVAVDGHQPEPDALQAVLSSWVR